MTRQSNLNRSVLSVTGADAAKFLQGLVTNDVTRLDQGIVYAALLSPKGKYLADFFLIPRGDAILIDVDAALAPGLLRRLTMYKLRAAVEVSQTDITVTRGVGTGPRGAFADPRDPDLGWRVYGAELAEDPEIDWDALRVRHKIPATNIELTPDDSYILEMGFERLNGVDFKKGCYVGQEVTARMKHKTQLRKGLARVTVQGDAPTGTPITASGKPAGTLLTRSGDTALAYLRFDRASAEMEAAGAQVAWAPEPI